MHNRFYCWYICSITLCLRIKLFEEQFAHFPPKTTLLLLLNQRQGAEFTLGEARWIDCAVLRRWCSFGWLNENWLMYRFKHHLLFSTSELTEYVFVLALESFELWVNCYFNARMAGSWLLGFFIDDSVSLSLSRVCMGSRKVLYFCFVPFLWYFHRGVSGMVVDIRHGTAAVVVLLGSLLPVTIQLGFSLPAFHISSLDCSFTFAASRLINPQPECLSSFVQTLGGPPPERIAQFARLCW